VALIQRGHLLVAHANAMQPGVLASRRGTWWVRCRYRESIPNNLTAGGDWRWVNREPWIWLARTPRHELVILEFPKAQSLYGSFIPTVKSPNSFASQVMTNARARKQYRIAEGQMLAVPPVGDKGVCVLIMRLPDSQNLAITALNYGRGSTSVQVNLT